MDNRPHTKEAGRNGDAGYNAEIVETNGTQTELFVAVQGIRNGQAHHQEDVRGARLPSQEKKGEEIQIGRRRRRNRPPPPQKQGVGQGSLLEHEEQRHRRLHLFQLQIIRQDKGIKPNPSDPTPHPLYETPPGEMVQCDWVEGIKLRTKAGRATPGGGVLPAFFIHIIRQWFRKIISRLYLHFFRFTEKLHDTFSVF